MMNRNSGLSALSPIAQQAEDFVQKKKIPPDQVVPFLLSMRMPGLAGAVAQRMRLDQADNMVKQMQGNPPAAPPTVVQENAAKLQNAEAMLAQGMGAMPAGVMDRAQFQGGITGEPMQPAQPPQRMAGGGPVAFSNGGGPAGIPNEMFDWEGWNTAYQEAQRAEDTVEMGRLERIAAAAKNYAEKNLPTFSKYASKLGPAAKYAIKGAPLIGATASLLDMSQTDAESLQRNSRLAQLGMDVDPTSGLKTYASGLAGIAESSIPFAGLFYKTPLERARTDTEKKVGDIQRAPGVVSALSADEQAIGKRYSDIVRQYGADSQQAKDFEAEYRKTMGRGSDDDQRALADWMARSAGEDKKEKGGKPTLGAAPVLADPFAKTRKEIERQLSEVEDVSKPEKRKEVFAREFKDKMDFYKEQGITKPIEDAQARVQTRREQIALQKDKDVGKALALMGFTMLKTKGSFANAIGEGGAAGLAAMETFEEKRQAALDKLEDRQTALDQQIAGLREKAGTAADARIDKLEAKRDMLRRDQLSLEQAGETLRNTQSFQWAMQEASFRANIEALDRRYGGLERDIEKDISKLRKVMQSNAPANVKAEAQREIDRLYEERTKAVEGGSASFRAAALKQLAQSQLFGGMPGATAAGGETDESLVSKWLR